MKEILAVQGKHGEEFGSPPFLFFKKAGYGVCVGGYDPNARGEGGAETGASHRLTGRQMQPNF